MHPRRFCRSFTLLVLMTGGCASGQRQPAADASVPVQDRMLRVSDQVHLQYLDWGGRGETIVLLPGLGNTAYIYSDFAPMLVERGFRVVALTRRAHGRSSQPATGYEPDSLANDIRVFLDTLGVARAHVIGHSFAGVEMTRFASLNPDRAGRLVYLDAAYDRKMQFAEERPDPSEPPRPTDADLASWDALIAFSRRPDYYFGRVWSPAMEADVRQRYVMGADGALQSRTPGRVYGAIIRPAAQAEPDYSGIRSPILSYYAMMETERLLPPNPSPALRDSALVYDREVIEPWTRSSIEQLRRAVPGARIVQLSNTYHHLFIQRPTETADEIAAFLRQPG